MSKIVIDLQKDILNSEIDILSILRKAKIIASKLNLVDFENWINNELNGYENYESIPEYRTVYGELKANNPYHGLIPIIMSSDLLSQINSRKLFDPISEIVSLANSNQSITYVLPKEASDLLCSNSGVNYQCYFIVSASQLTRIIESVKNNLLEWCLRLEKDGIVGDDFEFSDVEINKAKEIQQVFYNSNIINGNVNNSQMSSGNNTTNSFNLNNVDELIQKVKNSILEEEILKLDKEEALEIIDDIEKAIKEKKKTSVIKSALNGLKDFLINVGASVSAAIITSYIK